MLDQNELWLMDEELPLDEPADVLRTMPLRAPAPDRQEWNRDLALGGPAARPHSQEAPGDRLDGHFIDCTVHVMRTLDSMWVNT